MTPKQRNELDFENHLSKLGRRIFWEELNQNIKERKMIYEKAVKEAYAEEMNFLNERKRQYSIKFGGNR